MYECRSEAPTNEPTISMNWLLEPNHDYGSSLTDHLRHCLSVPRPVARLFSSFVSTLSGLRFRYISCCDGVSLHFFFYLSILSHHCTTSPPFLHFLFASLEISRFFFFFFFPHLLLLGTDTTSELWSFCLTFLRTQQLEHCHPPCAPGPPPAFWGDRSIQQRCRSHTPALSKAPLRSCDAAFNFSPSRLQPLVAATNNHRKNNNKKKKKKRRIKREKTSFVISPISAWLNRDGSFLSHQWSRVRPPRRCATLKGIYP